MGVESAQNCSFTARLDCRYLLYVPLDAGPQTPLVVTLHGFGSNPEVMLSLTAGLVGEACAIASIQAPHQFYLSGQPRDVGYCWATHKHPESSVRLHHEMVLQVLDEAGKQYGIPPERTVLAGFSQPVGLNYRLAATYPDAVRGVIGICGGLPGDWDEGSYRPVTASLLHIARRDDQIYPPVVTETYPERLRLRAGDVEFRMLEGAHRFPSKARPIVEAWLARILPRFR